VTTSLQHSLCLSSSLVAEGTLYQLFNDKLGSSNFFLLNVNGLQILFSKPPPLVLIIMKVTKKPHGQSLIYWSKRNVFTFREWEQVLHSYATWCVCVCVFSTTPFPSQKQRPRKGQEEKQKKRTERFAQATMKGRTTKWLQLKKKWKENSRVEENLLVIDTINLSYWERRKSGSDVLYKKNWSQRRGKWYTHTST
jgi:hypothetical protein